MSQMNNLGQGYNNNPSNTLNQNVQNLLESNDFYQQMQNQTNVDQQEPYFYALKSQNSNISNMGTSMYRDLLSNQFQLPPQENQNTGNRMTQVPNAQMSLLQQNLYNQYRRGGIPQMNYGQQNAMASFINSFQQNVPASPQNIQQTQNRTPQNTVSPVQTSSKPPSTPTQIQEQQEQSDQWTQKELQLLREALKKYPADKYPEQAMRFSTISRFIGTKNLIEVASKVNQLAQSEDTSGSVQEQKDEKRATRAKRDRKRKQPDEEEPKKPLRKKSKEEPNSTPQVIPQTMQHPQLSQQTLQSQSSLQQHPMVSGLPNNFGGNLSGLMPEQLSELNVPKPQQQGTFGQSTAQESEEFIRKLLNENCIIIAKIRENLLKGDIHNNLNLITQFRNNIIQVLTCMSKMPGIMSQMPPIPVKLNTICIPIQQSQNGG